MGIDAEILVRVRGRQNWLTEDQVARLAYSISEAIGHESFFTTNERRALHIVGPHMDEYEDDPGHKGKVVYHQDGPTIVADDDEQFIRVNLWGRYYGRGYERGNWPELCMIMQWLERRIPGSEVWYGGDSSGVCLEHFDADKRREVTNHWIDHGREPYTRHSTDGLLIKARGWAGTESPICPVDKVPMIATGGSRDYDFWCCNGCGSKATAHKDGRIAWADPSKGYPRWNDSGSIVQSDGPF